MAKSTDPMSYYHAEHMKRIGAASTFAELSLVAKSILSTMPRKVSMVCGPISTGGAGTPEANIQRFNVGIEAMARRGENVFTQLPFEIPMFRIVHKLSSTLDQNAINLRLLREFYEPLFSAGLIARLCFLPDWWTSFGATWEHEQACTRHLRRAYFLADFESRSSTAELIFDHDMASKSIAELRGMSSWSEHFL